MKVLIINMDSVGEGLAFAVRCNRAGHQVRLWLCPECNPTTGEGFRGIERIANWVTSMLWADLVVPTGNHDFMKKLAMFRDKGVCVFGPTPASADLEINRLAGMKLFEKAGIEVPEYQQFNSLQEAEKHVRKTEGRYVFKTLGDEEDKSLSYCSKSPADMIARLQRWQKLKLNPKGPVMLQKFIPGIEIGVSRWMGSKGFISKYNENFEHKKSCSGNYGPNCGEAGTVMKYVDHSALGKDVLAPLEKELVKLGHLGDVDVNVIVDEEGQALPLELTMRLGWPAANIMWATHKGDPAQWMRDACEGKDTLDVDTRHACGIVLAMPDYPYSKMTKAETEGVPIYGVGNANRKFIAPQAVKITIMPDMAGDKLVEKKTWVSTGDYLAVVTGVGKTVKQACKRAYDVVKDLHVPDLICRDDIGEKLQEEIPKLKGFGYATEFFY
jgi:phosphoribosylamine--glycine ligase